MKPTPTMALEQLSIQNDAPFRTDPSSWLALTGLDLRSGIVQTWSEKSWPSSHQIRAILQSSPKLARQ